MFILFAGGISVYMVAASSVFLPSESTGAKFEAGNLTRLLASLSMTVLLESKVGLYNDLSIVC